MTRRWAVAAAAAVVATLGLTPAAAAEPIGATSWMSRTWGLDGRVSELVPTSRGIVVGGTFSTAIAPSGASRPVSSMALWDPASGRFVDWPVEVSGAVLAAAVDGDTVYIGGDFSAVNGSTRRNLAAVSLSTGALLPWSVDAFGTVETLAAGAGSVYAGGAFTSIEDATARTAVNRVARLRADGFLDRTWSASISANDRVRVLVLASAGATLYLGGDFSALNNTSAYGRLAKVGTGATATIDTNFRSGANNNGNRSPVFDLDLVGESLLIASGGGGGGCTRQDAATGRTAWSHHSTGDIVAVRVLGPYAYCGGHFSGTGSFAGLDRYKAAEVTVSTGAITSWAPRVNSALGIWAMADTPSTLVVGGDFTRTGSSQQPRLGEFRDRSAVAVPSAPIDLRGTPGNAQVTLEWGAPDTDGGAQVNRYLVLRANAAGEFVQVGSTTSTSFTEAGLTNGVTYQYAVRASTSAGNGPASAPVSVTPRA
ncbi:fibronectin type III domain-containing protein [Knoellia sp. CPCC 206453]|uniref:fibronectin type III domain-containing protein n=1 Tax=Knoellia pratensis TaxID=3404796 RepID=UPI00360A18C7